MDYSLWHVESEYEAVCEPLVKGNYDACKLHSRPFFDLRAVREFNVAGNTDPV